MNNTEANQAKINRLIQDAQRRLPVGATITNKRGTARWNGSAWVYGLMSREHREMRRVSILRGE